MGFPEDISPHGYAIDDLFYLTTWLTGIAFVLVVIALVYLLIRYREREGRTAYYTHGENRGAMTFHLVLGALVFVMDVAVIYKEFSAWDALWGDPPAEEEAFHVRVVSERFALECPLSGRRRGLRCDRSGVIRRGQLDRPG